MSGAASVIFLRARALQQRKQTLNKARLLPRPRAVHRRWGLALTATRSARRAFASDAFHAMMTQRPARRLPMPDNPWNFDVPTQMRQFAEQSVEQAKKAVDGFLTAAQKTAAALETQAHTAQSGAKDVREKVMTFAEQNIANSFEFAQKLVRAKDVQEVLALQQEFLKAQMAAMQTQAKDLGSATQKAAADATKPKY